MRLDEGGWPVPTVVGDDGPGHGRGVDPPYHPEHAEPAQVLAPLLPSQYLGKVGEHDGHRATDAEDRKEGGGDRK